LRAEFSVFGFEFAYSFWIAHMIFTSNENWAELFGS
jgi:hypothetical protein